MANIQPEINDIRNAIYGEEVRGSICDALSAMNTETETFVNQAKSWAVGGTGTRQGEDTNNSKYWSEVAEASATDYTRVLETLGDEDISDVGTSVTNAINNLNDAIPNVPEWALEETKPTYSASEITNDTEVEGDDLGAAVNQLNQNLSDNSSLETTDKSVVGAINEVNSKVKQITKRYNITVADGVGYTPYFSFPLDCGLVTVRYRRENANIGGVSLACCGYGVTEIASAKHNGTSSVTYEGNSNNARIKLSASENGIYRVFVTYDSISSIG